MADGIEGDIDTTSEELGQVFDSAVEETSTGLRSVVDSVDPVKNASDLIDGAPDMPILGMSYNDAKSELAKPEPSKWDGFLQKFTGMSTGDFAPSKLSNHLTDKLGALKDLIVGQLLTCLKKWLLKMMNKYPLLNLLLNFDQVLADFIGKYRRLIEDFIDETIKNIIYRKLQIQQLAELNKKLNSLIRSICEKTSDKNARDFQNDFSVAEYVAAASAEDLANSLKDNIMDQSSGYPARDPESYVNGDGSLKTTSDRLRDAQSSLSTISEDDMTVEEAVAMRGLIEEIADLKQRDVDERNLATITC